ncbi:hypothetical protein BDV36DRAFT_269566 [Aspergillus pseudocaelatus]|uniref:Uncharacterized protein n=1 Tax=Aspergillus pseudocaelatus TaxID=1825620 RepID=A0ABQ6W7W9_9EURO|nr:hypothetical protein BDV36DRAFT_269566 [Aspergillus pseudocaelatus]
MHYAPCVVWYLRMPSFFCFVFLVTLDYPTDPQRSTFSFELYGSLCLSLYHDYYPVRFTLE